MVLSNAKGLKDKAHAFFMVDTAAFLLWYDNEGLSSCVLIWACNNGHGCNLNLVLWNWFSYACREHNIPILKKMIHSILSLKDKCIDLNVMYCIFFTLFWQFTLSLQPASDGLCVRLAKESTSGWLIMHCVLHFCDECCVADCAYSCDPRYLIKQCGVFVWECN